MNMTVKTGRETIHSLLAKTFKSLIVMIDIKL